MAFNALKNMMLNEDVDIKVINAIKSLQTFSATVNFADVLYVSSAGDNSDGSSWDKAYTSITTALDWIAANQSSGEFHLVLIGAGSFDINTTGNPTYDEKIAIVGLGQNISKITNSHASATSVLKLTGIGYMANLMIDTGATSIDGLLLNGTSVDGYEIDNVYFEGDSCTGAMSLLKIDGAAEYIKVTNCKFHGVAANTTAIHLDSCSEAWFRHIWIDTALIGIHLDNAGDDSNHFRDIHFDACTTGVQIDLAGATSNHFEDLQFYSCTTNISDSGTSTLFWDLHLLPKPAATVTPSNLTGVTVTAGAGANTYGAAVTEIRAAASATKPYYVTGILIEPATAEKWGIALFDDGGTTAFWEGVLEQARGVANVAQREMFPDKYLCGQGTQLSAKVKSETGGNNVLIWLYLEII